MLFLVLFSCSNVAHTVLFSSVMNQFEAARDGDLQYLRVALTVCNVNDGNMYGWTALNLAAGNGRVDCVKYCVEMGANVNARTRRGCTPLRLASWNGNANVVRVLLDAGANVDVTDTSGRTPLHCAIRNKHVDVGRLLIDWEAKLSSVQRDDDVPAIPDWITTFIESRSNCRSVSIAIIGIHKYHRTTVTRNNDLNVLRLISKHIWSTRIDDAWVVKNDENEG
jgi:ankyrin repeat protein